jgi:hypothetical protein
MLATERLTRRSSSRTIPVANFLRHQWLYQPGVTMSLDEVYGKVESNPVGSSGLIRTIDDRMVSFHSARGESGGF